MRRSYLDEVTQQVHHEQSAPGLSFDRGRHPSREQVLDMTSAAHLVHQGFVLAIRPRRRSPRGRARRLTACAPIATPAP